jgi:tetratricopeptide (TPR) repeat protein
MASVDSPTTTTCSFNRSSVLNPPQKDAQQTATQNVTSFITTTDIMNILNKSLQSDYSTDMDDTTLSRQQSPQLAHHQPSHPLPHFCLHRRLPDGSTRPATASEQRAADCQQQLEQAAAAVGQLSTAEQKRDFVTTQRAAGNQYYAVADYERAMDTYLTCLPALATTTTTTAHESSTSTSQTENEDEQQRRLLFAKVLNNLAQTTLQVKSYAKTEQFCSMALQQLRVEQEISAEPVPVKDHSNNNNNDDTTAAAAACWSTSRTSTSDDYSQQISKLYFRRAKARRLRGDYGLAATDLEQSRAWWPCDDDRSTAARRSIETEFQFLQQARTQGRRNQQQQRQALQRAMATQPQQPESPDTYFGLRQRSATSTTVSSAVQPNGPRRRAYSTLRAPSRQQQPCGSPRRQQQPWQHYLTVVGTVAEQMLEWIGDDDTAANNSNNSKTKDRHGRWHDKAE